MTATAALDGIIPARAGFTLHRPRDHHHGADHPRSRGVYPVTRATFRSSSGSSPLARGLLRIWDRECYLPGIIPARAGFTPPPRTVSAGSWDHPRSRGVYGPGASRPGPGAGSSPLARGLRVSRGHDDEREGIIPARAGFTTCTTSAPRSSPDHPRSRGVYLQTTYEEMAGQGSSPLARGLPLGEDPHRGAGRIIPARAGFTCGMRPVSATTVGSSPLARGLRHGEG